MKHGAQPTGHARDGCPSDRGRVPIHGAVKQYKHEKNYDVIFFVCLAMTNKTYDVLEAVSAENRVL